MTADRTEFKVKGEELVKKVKQLIHEGNVRRVIIKDKEGLVFMEIPLTVGIVGTALIPIWAALGALAAVVADFTIEVVKKEETQGEE